MPNATVTIGSTTVTLTEEEGRVLFLAAIRVSRRCGPIAVTPHTMVAVSPATPISITIENGFTEDYNPQAIVDKAFKRDPKGYTM